MFEMISNSSIFSRNGIHDTFQIFAYPETDWKAFSITKVKIPIFAIYKRIFGKYKSRLSRTSRVRLSFNLNGEKCTSYIRFLVCFFFLCISILGHKSISNGICCRKRSSIYSVWNIDEWANLWSDVSKYLQIFSNFSTLQNQSECDRIFSFF